MVCSGVASIAIRSLAHAGEVITDRTQQEEVISIFEKINKETGWRIGFVYKELKEKWGWAEEPSPEQLAQTHTAARQEKERQEQQKQQHQQQQMQQAHAAQQQQHAASARLHIQFAEYGAKHVTACCATHASSPKHTSSPTTATTTTAATERRRKTEQKDTFGHLEPDVRQSRLQSAPASLSGCLCGPEFGLWPSSGRSLVEFVGKLGDGYIGNSEIFKQDGYGTEKLVRIRLLLSDGVSLERVDSY
jgi:hypothetical protein